MDDLVGRYARLKARCERLLTSAANASQRDAARITALKDEVERLKADKAGLVSLLCEAQVKLVDVQGSYATGNYACNLLTRITAAIEQHGGETDG